VSERDAIDAYDALLRALREHKLEWLADQINDEVVLGKTKPERIAVFRESDWPVAVLESVAPRPKPPSAEFLTRVDYSPKEKFDIAVGAIRVVVIGATKIQDALTEAVGLNEHEIVFAPGETGDTRHAFRSSEVSSHRNAAASLGHYLDELVEDIGT
jgi:hypothetical protein